VKDASVEDHDIIVIGASAGGVEALSRLCGALPEDFPGTIFIVLHTTASGESRLPEILNRRGSLTARHPVPDTKIEPGAIYVASANRHLIIDNGRVTMTTGPRRNGYRPSINALFESAARNYGSRVAGVFLSGSLDDGTLGLLKIKKSGGATLVQSPEEAMFTGMPTSALEQVDVDFCGTVAEIAGKLIEYAGIGSEVKTAGMTGESNYSSAGQSASPDNDGARDPITGFTCPECGGVLQEMNTGDYLHFRCHVGHEVSEKSLMQSQAEEIERALWTALRILEERLQYLRELDDRRAGRAHSGAASARELSNGVPARPGRRSAARSDARPAGSRAPGGPARARGG
jgi:two-component system chemotaxis response regulator CheB